jgi:hypothetical protein
VFFLAYTWLADTWPGWSEVIGLKVRDLSILRKRAVYQTSTVAAA